MHESLGQFSKVRSFFVERERSQQPFRDWGCEIVACPLVWNSVKHLLRKRLHLKRSVLGKYRTTVPSDGILRSECSTSVLAGPGYIQLYFGKKILCILKQNTLGVRNQNLYSFSRFCLVFGRSKMSENQTKSDCFIIFWKLSSLAHENWSPGHRDFGQSLLCVFLH